AIEMMDLAKHVQHNSRLPVQVRRVRCSDVWRETDALQSRGPPWSPNDVRQVTRVVQREQISLAHIVVTTNKTDVVLPRVAVFEMHLRIVRDREVMRVAMTIERVRIVDEDDIKLARPSRGV